MPVLLTWVYFNWGSTEFDQISGEGCDAASVLGEAHQQQSSAPSTGPSRPIAAHVMVESRLSQPT
jgi:hypothetical protein